MKDLIEMESIAVIDMEMSVLYIYDVPKAWGTEETEAFIESKNHRLSTSTWGAFDGVIADNRDSAKICDVISPDGFSIKAVGYYANPEEAGEGLDEWIQQFTAQGYYASNHGRIPIEQLALHCKLITIEMTNKETVDEGVQGSLDCLFDDLKDEFNLENGDISPNQMERLEKIQNDLSDLVLEWVEQNTPKKLKPLFDSMRGD